MKKEYYEIYEILYAEYIYDLRNKRGMLFPTDEYQIVRQIRKSIDSADKEDRLRPDARYFLLVNFHHLIVKPLVEQKPSRGFRSEKDFIELEKMIQSDLREIVTDSISDPSQTEISGHQIMKSIDKLWNGLKTTKLEIWG